MLNYNPRLKHYARRLRSDMTDAEQKLWSRVRGKQIGGVQFYRQKPVGNFIVDLYCPKAGLVVEVDGAQHFEPEHRRRDEQRDAYLARQGLRVLRFDDRQVLQELDAVLEVICRVVAERTGNLPSPLWKRGDEMGRYHPMEALTPPAPFWKRADEMAQLPESGGTMVRAIAFRSPPLQKGG